ncbi:hypothetical protein LIA77_03849 [Sarocladium implicatum]|nr:hypothetical protein LIA77_03849 [Sarocladium implicatum]
MSLSQSRVGAARQPQATCAEWRRERLLSLFPRSGESIAQMPRGEEDRLSDRPEVQRQRLSPGRNAAVTRSKGELHRMPFGELTAKDISANHVAPSHFCHPICYFHHNFSECDTGAPG